jgi:16S rRNA (cytidine1402-2'-O)-methyltransferase
MTTAPASALPASAAAGILPTFSGLPGTSGSPADAAAPLGGDPQLSGSHRPAPAWQALADAAAAQQYPLATLYVVATPIGNVADLSWRALHTLGLVDAVACEDTRVSGQLLKRLGLHRPLLTLHEHNELEAAAAIVARLQRGERIAYVSDAGTPAVSDPGARLVAAVRAAGLRVLPLPGASSVSAALSAAGDGAAEGHVFHGFLPSKANARSQALSQALAALQLGAAAPAGKALSLVLFEAPHRIAELCDELARQVPQRTVTLCRELTKQFEQIVSLPAAELPAWLKADADHGRGEFVVVVHAPARQPAAAHDTLAPLAERLLVTLLAELPLKQAAALAAQALDLPRKQLYQRALELKQQAPDPEHGERPDPTED